MKVQQKQSPFSSFPNPSSYEHTQSSFEILQAGKQDGAKGVGSRQTPACVLDFSICHAMPPPPPSPVNSSELITSLFNCLISNQQLLILPHFSSIPCSFSQFLLLFPSLHLWNSVGGAMCFIYIMNVSTTKETSWASLAQTLPNRKTVPVSLRWQRAVR